MHVCFGYLVCHNRYATNFRLLKIHIIVIRFVLKLGSRSHIEADVFQSLCWLRVSKRVYQILLNHVFKIKSANSPDNMSEHFVPRSSMHSYGTSFRENYCFFRIWQKKSHLHCLLVLRFYGLVNPMESCQERSVYITTLLHSPLSS